MTQKEAIKILRETYDNALFSVRTALATLIPELKESKDERIRKWLISVFSNREKDLIDQSFCDITVSEVIAWLEKQCTVIEDAISMDINLETEWDDIHKFLRNNLDDKKAKLLIIKEE